MILLLLFFFHCVYCKYTYNHIIKTDFKSSVELNDIMSSKKYFDLYLEEVNADNIVFDPCFNTTNLEFPFKINYSSQPKISLLPLKFPKISILQSWKKEGELVKGNIKCSLIDFDLELEIKQNTSDIDNVYINLNSKINSKIFFVPNKALKYALYDYESIFHKIIKKINKINKIE